VFHRMRDRRPARRNGRAGDGSRPAPKCAEWRGRRSSRWYVAVPDNVTRTIIAEAGQNGTPASMAAATIPPRGPRAASVPNPGNSPFHQRAWSQSKTDDRGIASCQGRRKLENPV